MAQNLMVKATGLHTFQNYLSEIPEGSLVRADNAVINADGIIESRRGYAIYGDEFPLDNDRAKQLLAYKGRILRHFNTTLQFDSDGAGTFVDFTGSVEELEDGLRIKGVEGNGNFLFTTLEGIKKLSVANVSNLDASSVTDAGAPKAITIRGTANTGTPGFLDVSSKVAYRVVWGYKDANNNLILGSPSSRIVVENTNVALTAVVDLEILIPDGITTAHFYQLYRSAVVPNTLEPDDELNLVFETNPTSAEITAGSLTVTDITPEDFREGGALLYTNPVSGEGILQSNDPPPLSKDLALFKNFMFYANTSTRHGLFINLLSTTGFTDGVTKLIISDGVDTEEYTFDTTENAALKQVFRSTDPSVSIAVDETARSLEYVINKQTGGLIYAYYLSGPNDVPGALLFQRRDQADMPFYVATNDSAVSEKWNPDLPVTNSITAITTGATPTVTTAAPHGYITGQSIVLYGTDSTPIVDGIHVITVTGPSDFTFTASPPVTVAGTTGFTLSTDDVASSNEVAPNRIYYSKLQQLEAVPSVNFIDVGPKDQPIKRILALRDSLFILKTDGVYRLTGDTASSFSVFLFDGSTQIFASDTAVVLNNQIYMLAENGVNSVSDTGTAIISRPIEDKILKLLTPQYTASTTANFGIAYEYDNSYLLWMVTDTIDEWATQAFRYNVFTQTWTRWDMEKTCGVVNTNGDNKMYLGAADTNAIERERKDLDRFDYADRQLLQTIPPNAFNGRILTVGSTADFRVGDAIVQTQYLTIAQFNRLMRKLDIDGGVAGGFFAAFGMSPGDSLTTQMTLFVAELNIQDPSTVYVFSGTVNPVTIQSEFNVIIGQLNLSPNINFTNYQTSVGTVVYDAVVESVNNLQVQITVNYPVPFVEGECYLYKAIYMTVDWAPITMGDASILKHISEATMLFGNSGFYGATVAYASDLSKNYEIVNFLRDGNGEWGAFLWGQHTWGGEGNQIPIRTYVPQQKQRCRWINPRFNHMFALENPTLYGISFTFEPTSQRGYR